MIDNSDAQELFLFSLGNNVSSIPLCDSEKL